MALWYNCGNGLVKTYIANSDIHLDTYLYCPGPSLTDVEGLDIHVPGAITFALNTAYPKVKPDIWIGSDEPQCYDRRLLHEPCMKIYRGGYQSHSCNGREIQQYPRTFFADCENVHDPLEMLNRRAHDVVFVWNRNTFTMVLHVMIWMGARNIHLVGCNFGGSRDYYDDRKLSNELRDYNRRLYQDQVEFMRKLVPVAKSRGIVFKSCTKDSPINDFMDFVPLKEPLTTLTQKEYDAQQAVEMAAVEQAAQQAYLLDIQQHAAQYTLENCYRMLLDQLRGDESHEAMSGEEYATRMAALMMSDPVKFQKMFVAFSFVQSQLLHDLGDTWADRAQWRDVPALVTAAQERLAMLG